MSDGTILDTVVFLVAMLVLFCIAMGALGAVAEFVRWWSTSRTPSIYEPMGKERRHD